MDKKLLTILHCPITHKGLGLANETTLKGVANQEGQTLTEPLHEGLLTDDGKVLYPIVDGIPVLLSGESINMEQFG